MSEFQIFLLMIVVFAINDWLIIWNYKRRQTRKYEKFLRAVQVEYPDAKLSFIAVESSDEEAMTMLEQQIRTHRYHNKT